VSDKKELKIGGYIIKEYDVDCFEIVRDFGSARKSVVMAGGDLESIFGALMSVEKTTIKYKNDGGYYETEWVLK
jgi:hypothetical protein